MCGTFSVRIKIHGALSKVSDEKQPAEPAQARTETAAEAARLAAFTVPSELSTVKKQLMT